MKNHKTSSSFENSFLSVLDSNKPVHGMFTFVISNVKDGHISPLRSFYWHQTINTCSTIDNCSANTVPSVFLLHTNRWSATINDIGVRSQEVIELTLTRRINKHFEKWNALGETFTHVESPKFNLDTFQYWIYVRQFKKKNWECGRPSRPYRRTKQLIKWPLEKKIV